MCISQTLPQGTLPVIKTPTNINPATTNYQINRPNNNPYNPSELNNINTRNQAIIREVAEHEMIMKEANRQKDISVLLSGKFPYQYNNEKGTECYRLAFDEIKSMLEGNSELNLGKAVFLVENAYYENSIDYSDFQNAIQGDVDLCNNIIESQKLDKNSDIVKHSTLFRYISDTLTWRDKTTKQRYYHYPIKYDYDDYKSEINYDSHFVTTLMRTGKGQCHSMPLYYLILAEEMGVDAYWTFSPKHSFVKIQEKGVWYNLELTCKAILSDAHYMNNSYIKAEAIKNRIYLEPLDKSNSVAEMMIDLARGYYQKYGYDDFYMQCVETAEKHLDNKLNPLLLKSAYQTRVTLVLAQLLNAPNPDAMKEVSPEAYKHYEKMQEQYSQIDNLGFEELPEDLYARWLEHLAKEKEKSEKLPSIFINIPKERRN